MRNIKLTGREASLVRVMGFAEPMSGTEIQQNSSMTAEDLTDTLNSLISAGFVESEPYYEQVRDGGDADDEVRSESFLRAPNQSGPAPLLSRPC